MTSAEMWRANEIARAKGRAMAFEEEGLCALSDCDPSVGDVSSADGTGFFVELVPDNRVALWIAAPIATVVRLTKKQALAAAALLTLAAAHLPDDED